MKIKARKGVTIVYPKKLVDPDGRKRQIVDRIPPDRNAVILWRDQFGSIHGVGFGDIDTETQRYDETVREFIERALAVIDPQTGPLEP